jgi:hypothetical protein
MEIDDVQIASAGDFVAGNESVAGQVVEGRVHVQRVGGQNGQFDSPGIVDEPPLPIGQAPQASEQDPGQRGQGQERLIRKKPGPQLAGAHRHV